MIFLTLIFSPLLCFLYLTTFFEFMVVRFQAINNEMDRHCLNFYHNFSIFFCINVCVFLILMFDKLAAYSSILMYIKNHFKENLNQQNK